MTTKKKVSKKKATKKVAKKVVRRAQPQSTSRQVTVEGVFDRAERVIRQNRAAIDARIDELVRLTGGTAADRNAVLSALTDYLESDVLNDHDDENEDEDEGGTTTLFLSGDLVVEYDSREELDQKIAELRRQATSVGITNFEVDED